MSVTSTAKGLIVAPLSILPIASFTGGGGENSGSVQGVFQGVLNSQPGIPTGEGMTMAEIQASVAELPQTPLAEMPLADYTSDHGDDSELEEPESGDENDAPQEPTPSDSDYEEYMGGAAYVYVPFISGSNDREHS